MKILPCDSGKKVDLRLVVVIKDARKMMGGRRMLPEEAQENNFETVIIMSNF